MAKSLKQIFFGSMYAVSTSIYLEFPEKVCQNTKNRVFIYDVSDDVFILKKNAAPKFCTVVLYKNHEYFVILHTFELETIEELQKKYRHPWWALSSKHHLSSNRTLLQWIDTRAKVLKSKTIKDICVYAKLVHQLGINIYYNHPNQKLNIEYLLPYVFISYNVHQLSFATHFSCIVENKHCSLKVLFYDFKANIMLRMSTDQNQLFPPKNAVGEFTTKDIVLRPIEKNDIYTRKLYLIALLKWYTKIEINNKVFLLQQKQNNIFTSGAFFRVFQEMLLQILSDNYIRHYRFLWRKSYASFPITTYRFHVFEGYDDIEPNQFVDSYVIMSTPHDLVKQDKNGFLYTLVWEILYNIRNLYIQLSTLTIPDSVKKYRMVFLQLLGCFRAIHATQNKYELIVNTKNYDHDFYMNNKQRLFLFFDDSLSCFCIIYNNVIFILHDVHNTYETVLPKTLKSNSTEMKHVNIYRSYLQFFAFFHSKHYISIVYQIIMTEILNFNHQIYKLLSFKFEIKKFDDIAIPEILKIQNYLNV